MLKIIMAIGMLMLMPLQSAKPTQQDSYTTGGDVMPAAAGIMDPIHLELLHHQGRIHHIHLEEKQSQLMATMVVLLIQAV